MLECFQSRDEMLLADAQCILTVCADEWLVHSVEHVAQILCRA